MDAGFDGVYIKNYRLGVYERVDEKVDCPANFSWIQTLTNSA